MEERHIDDQDELFNPNRPSLRYIDHHIRPNCFNLSKRYTLAILLHIGFLIIFAIRSNVCFINESIFKNLYPNATEIEIFDKMATIQIEMDAYFLLANIIIQIPAGIMSYKFPSQHVFGICILASSMIAIISSLSLKWINFEFGYATFLQGLVQSATFSAVHGILQHWAVPAERATLSTLAYSGTFMGIFFGVFFSGFICSYFAEEHSLALFGVAGICWYIAWLWLVFEHPEYHPTISDSEFEYIKRHIHSPTEKPPIPWKQIFSSLPCWAIFVVYLCRSFNSYYLFQADYMQYNYVRNNGRGLLIELPTLVMIIIVPASGYLADRISTTTSLSVTSIRKYYICGGLLLEVIAYIPGLFLTQSSMPYLIDTAIIDLIFYSFTISGFFVNHLDIAPMYACVTMSIANLFASLFGGIINYTGGHRPVGNIAFFGVMTVIHLFGVIFYGIWGSGELQPWAKPKVIENEQNPMVRNNETDNENF